MFDPILNKLILPSLDEIAIAIVKRDKARIIPTGSFVLYSLELSEQIPLNIVCYTDGKVRKIKLDNGTISFKKASSKKLALRGKISKLVVLLLSEIGKDNLTENEENKIQSLLQQENKEDLMHDLKLALQWIAEIMAKNL